MDDVTKFKCVEQIDDTFEDVSGNEEQPPVAAVYARTAQIGGPWSCERQVRAAKAYAVAEGLDLRSTYVDEGCSGATLAGRDGLKRLLADARKSSFQVLITKPDRLSRSLLDLLSICNELSNFGVSIYTLDGGAMTSADAIVYAYLGEADRTRFSALCAAGRRHAAARGRLVSPVFGYRYDPERRGDYVVDPDKAQIVRRIFGRLAEGVTPAAVGRELTAEGVPIKTANRVRAIARCPTYTGMVTWGRTKRVCDPHTGSFVTRPTPRNHRIVARRDDLAIVSGEVWTRVASRLDARSPRKGAKPQ